MTFTSNSQAYKNYLEQAKMSLERGDTKRARELFLKAAEITNQLCINATNQETKTQYYRLTKSILECMRNSCDKQKEQSCRSSNDSEKQIPVANINTPKITLEQALEKLHSLIGLGQIKTLIDSLVNQIKTFRMRKQADMKVPEMTYHMVFTGNPGTGKTTVARIVSEIYCSLGLLSKGHTVEVDRSDLVAGYVGQSAIKTKAVIEKAKGGVLFIDEAYSLVSGGENDFGAEVIATLLTAMENNRDDLIVIVAGYKDEMNDFVQSNPGLKSRFKNFCHFEDYSPEELQQIFMKLCADNQYILDAQAEQAMKELFSNSYQQRDENFGNARFVRNLFEDVVRRQSNRIVNKTQPITREELATIILQDLQFDNYKQSAMEDNNT